MTAADNHQYIPGVCNIGRAEIEQRKRIGWVALAVTAGVWIAFAVFDVAPVYRLALFVPASLAATGFLQADRHFCATLGLLSVFNFGSTVGKADPVELAEFRRRDRHTALEIAQIFDRFGAELPESAANVALS